MASHGIYLVGSVPLASASDVFATVSASLGDRVRWIPDGETGKRLEWINSFQSFLATHPDFELTGASFKHHDKAAPKQRFRLRDGVKPEDVRFAELPYRHDALASYAEFAALKRAGKIASGVKFQVDLVPSFSIIRGFFEEPLHGVLDAAWNEALGREIDAIAAAIPHDQLAMQFDVASAVFFRLQDGGPTPYGRDKAEMLAHFGGVTAELSNRVAPDIDLLFHFCYGDSGHKHMIEPIDMADMVAMANFLATHITRPIQLIHMPVPRDRDDDEYFAPLRDLRLAPETKICLGLVHMTGGLAGTRRRMETADRHARDYLIATECGFGRRDPASVRDLLALHLAASA